MRADQVEEMLGLRDAAGRVALDEVDADDMQGAGAGDGDGGPGKIAVLDVGVVPLAVSHNGVSGNNTIGELGSAFFAGKVGARAQQEMGKVLGRALSVVKFLNGKNVGVEGLNNANAGGFVSLRRVLGEVGGGNGQGQYAGGGSQSNGSAPEPNPMESNTHGPKTIPMAGG